MWLTVKIIYLNLVHWRSKNVKLRYEKYLKYWGIVKLLKLIQNQPNMRCIQSRPVQ